MKMSINKFKAKTAVAIITCNRENFLLESLKSIDPNAVDQIYVVNAGGIIKPLPDHVKLIKTKRNPTPVGIAKNMALHQMKNDGYDYLFLVEDDVRIKDNKVFEKYIETAADSGLWAGQLSYGVHGGIAGGNVSQDGKPQKRVVVEYSKHKVSLYRHSFQAFTLYHSNVLNYIGYINESYTNAAEHLDHYYTAYLKNLGCNFWYFPDIENSYDYLEDIDSDHKSSVIRSSQDFKKNFSDGWGLFKQRFGKYPTELPDSEVDKVNERLTFLENNYSQKQLLETVDNENQ